MTPDPHRIESIFDDALELAPADRPAFAERACAGDDALLAAVMRLLRAHDSADRTEFLPEVNAARDPRADEEERPGTILDRFTLRERIGEGAFGVVWVAEQSHPVRRLVALKILKPGMDSREIVARFEAERQALAMMHHPNIATVFDAGTNERGRPFFVMELVRGVPITEFCDRNAMPAAERLRLFALVCRAVQHAHEKGVIHRDLKPSNILITLHDGDPVPKVIDFGVAKAIGPELTGRTLYTGFHQLIGTPTYMSPEQAEMSGLDLDARSDIYSLGVLLYELLTGSTPIEREELRRVAVAEMARLVREREAPRPSTRITTMGEGERSVVASRRGLSPRSLSKMLRGDLDWIVLKALEKDRRRRYESASELAEDLGRYLSDKPVSARAPRWSYRLHKWTRRHRRGLAAAVPAMMLGALALYFYIERPPARSESSEAAATSLDRKAIAVLPFANRSDLKADEYFTDGIHADLLTQMSRLQGIKALSRDSVMPYRNTSKRLSEVGDELGVGTIVEGGVQRIGDLLQVNAQLVDVQTGVNLWAETFTRELTADNVFGIQREIAESVAGALQAALSLDERKRLRKLPTENLAALEAYFRGKACDYSAEGQEEAADWYQKAIAADPEFALAYALLAHTYMNQVWYSGLSFSEQVSKARPLVERALELDPDLSEAYLVIGQFYRENRDLVGTEAAFQRAVELDPRNVSAHVGYALFLNWDKKDYDHALVMIDKALELQPGNEGLLGQRATILYHLGRYEEAVALLDPVVRDKPWVNGAFLWLGRCRIALDRDYVEAVRLARKAHELQPSGPWAPAFVFEVFQALQDDKQQRFWLKRTLEGYAGAEYVPALQIQGLLLDGKVAEAGQLWAREHAADHLPGTPIDGEVFRRLLSADLRGGRPELARDRYEKTNPGWFTPAAEIPRHADTNDYDNQINCLGLAMVLQQLSESGQANHLLDGLEEAIDPAAHDLRAYAGFVRGDREACVRHLSQLGDRPGARFERLLAAGFWDPMRELPEMQALSDSVRRHMEEQRERIRELEATGELAALPPLEE